MRQTTIICDNCKEEIKSPDEPVTKIVVDSMNATSVDIDLTLKTAHHPDGTDICRACSLSALRRAIGELLHAQEGKTYP